MQGTSHVRSLVRLLIGAVLLCLAWLVLTSGQASAAERPAPSHPLSDLGRTVPLGDGEGLGDALGSALATSSAPAERPANNAAKTAGSAKSSASPVKSHPSSTKATNEKHSGAVTSAIRPVAMADAADPITVPASLVPTSVREAAVVVAPTLDRVGAAARSTVDAGQTLVTDVAQVAGSVPVAGEPLARVADAVVGLVQTTPVMGVPAPIVPLPIGVGSPTDGVPPPTVPEAVATEQDRSAARAGSLPTFSRDGRAFVIADGSTPSRPEASGRAAVPAGPGGHGEPTGAWAPLDSSPALPSQPSPTGGATQGGPDPATTSATVALPTSSLFGRSSADWRVPRGLPAHPGTRPD